MRRVIKWVGALMGVALLLLIAAFFRGRWRGPNAAQSKAMALLQTHAQPAGRNAWAVFWLMDYAVPADRIDAVYAADRTKLAHWLRKRSDQIGSKSAPFVSSAARTYAKLPDIDASDRKRLCTFKTDDCLATVRAHAEQTSAVLAHHRQRLRRYRAIDQDAVLWNNLSDDMQAPIPDFSGPAMLQQTAAALDFVRGRHAQALTETCADALTMRHLHTHTNSLIGSILTAVWMEADERLLTAMLAKTGPSQPIPSTCGKAFAPVVTADVDLCPSMRTQYRGLDTVLSDMKKTKRHAGWRTWLLFDWHHGFGRMVAATYAWPCTPSMHQAMLADRKIDPHDQPQARYDMFDQLSNAIGVILARVSKPDLAQYMNRTEDYAASLRLTAWVLRQRGKERATSAERSRIDKQLAQLGSHGARNFRLSPDGEQVRMTLYHHIPHGRKQLVLSLPMATQAGAPSP